MLQPLHFHHVYILFRKKSLSLPVQLSSYLLMLVAVYVEIVVFHAQELP